jgi:phage repressor protein C with HTH and peptisase S24 domain
MFDTMCNMSEDDIRHEMLHDRAKRLIAAREAAGFTKASEAARHFRWTESTYRSHENGNRPIRDEDAAKYAAGLRKRGVKVTEQSIMYGSGDDEPETPPERSQDVKIMGKIGAGSVIEPDIEQVPDDGIFQIQLPFPVPDELIGFQVDGPSMMPYQEDGNIVLVWKEQQKSIESFYGEPAAVRTADGRRYLKIIQPGKNKNFVNLESFNAKPIINVRIEWIGEICLWLPKGQVQRIAARENARERKAQNTTRRKPTAERDENAKK